jgi:dihydroorotate dehydrogenase electron transfer subunit
MDQQPLSHPARDVWWMSIKAPSIAAQARPGQFIMLKMDHTPYILARPFSIAGVNDECIFLLYKQTGAMTDLMPHLHEGAKIILWGPLGHGFNLDHAPLLLIAGGAGIAPMLFTWQISSNATLLAGFADWQNFNRLSVILRELRHFSPPIPAGPDTLLTPQSIYITSLAPYWTAGSGLATDPLLNPQNSGYIKSHNSILTCGPQPMMKRVVSIGREHGIACQIAAESPMACGLGVCMGCALPAAGGDYLYLCKQGPALQAEELDWDRLCL